MREGEVPFGSRKKKRLPSPFLLSADSRQTLKMELSWPVGVVYREPRTQIVEQFLEVAKQVFAPEE